MVVLPLIVLIIDCVICKCRCFVLFVPVSDIAFLFIYSRHMYVLLIGFVLILFQSEHSIILLWYIVCMM